MKKRSDKKLMLFGPPNCGKTSILLSIFGSVEPDLILASPAEPTRGVDNAVYTWGHVKIGVFDLSGQEMEIFMTQERDFIFPGTDELLIVFEFGMNVNKINGLLKHLWPIIQKYNIKYNYVLIHKIDKAPSKEVEEEFISNLQKIVDNSFGINNLKVFGTSLYPEYYGKFKFQMDWMLTALEISLRNIKEMRSVPVSESLLKSLRTTGFLDVNLEDESLAEIPKPAKNAFNEMSTIKKDTDFKEFDREE